MEGKKKITFCGIAFDKPIFAQTSDRCFEEKTIISREILAATQEIEKKPISEVSARSLAWLEAAKWLPQSLKVIKENEMIKPWKNP